jgi:TPR repeat protein
MNDEDINNKHLPLFQRWFHHPHPPQTPAPDVEIEAEQGNADAQFHLGLKYALADGLAQDFGQAAKWYRKAAEQNHPLAQCNLGAMYAGGQGVPQDEGAAESWFSKAAEQGDAGAQHHLGINRHRASLRGEPQTLPESRIEAYKWFVLAAAQGYRGSDAARDSVALQMTHTDVLEAIRRAGRFAPSLGVIPLPPMNNPQTTEVH